MVFYDHGGHIIFSFTNDIVRQKVEGFKIIEYVSLGYLNKNRMRDSWMILKCVNHSGILFLIGFHLQSNSFVIIQRIVLEHYGK